MKKIEGLFSQLAAAATEIKGQIATLDKRIAEASSERNKLTTGRVSKADFLLYVRADIRHKAESFKSTLAQSIKPVATHGFGTLEGMLKGDVGLGVQYAADSRGAPFYYLEEQMYQGVKQIVESLDWDNEAETVAARKELITELDRTIKELNSERESLASNLLRAGVQG